MRLGASYHWSYSLVLLSMRMSDIDVWPHCQLCELCAWWGGKFYPAGLRDQKTSLSQAAPGGENILTPGPQGSAWAGWSTVNQDLAGYY